VPGARITALEREPAALALLHAAIELNAASIDIVPGDLADPPVSLRQRSFAHVVTNPPFTTPTAWGAGEGAKVHAHRESTPIATWLGYGLRRLEPDGTLSLIHRTDRLPAILAALEGAAGDIRVLPLWAKPDASEARRLIVRARKGARAPFRLLKGLVLHEANGHFTPAAEAILREGAALPLDS
jgi:tRNA1(Val) A37 N6-methylase TrmN6